VAFVMCRLWASHREKARGTKAFVPIARRARARQKGSFVKQSAGAESLLRT
jgi:hypothetical protein